MSTNGNNQIPCEDYSEDDMFHCFCHERKIRDFSQKRNPLSKLFSILEDVVLKA